MGKQLLPQEPLVPKHLPLLNHKVEMLGEGGTVWTAAPPLHHLDDPLRQEVHPPGALLLRVGEARGGGEQRLHVPSDVGDEGGGAPVEKVDLADDVFPGPEQRLPAQVARQPAQDGVLVEGGLDLKNVLQVLFDGLGQVVLHLLFAKILRGHCNKLWRKLACPLHLRHQVRDCANDVPECGRAHKHGHCDVPPFHIILRRDVTISNSCHGSERPVEASQVAFKKCISRI
mmetsp:Transcript_1692/g.2814  ORF Transcript_1692/g.2814 Transcript_1692/m.2814 type:complete len:229 (+) Transcript_1692:1934-2620(+)